MKLIRLLILFGNLSFIIVITYLGYYFFLKGILRSEEGYFDPIQIVPPEPTNTYFPKGSAGKTKSEYAAMNAWLGSLVPKEEIAEPPPKMPSEDVDMLRSQVQIKGIVYNPLFPSRSGAHVFVSGIPRFFLSGDYDRLSPTLNFVLANVKEVTPGQEYILVFQKGDGKAVELQYQRSGR